MIRDRLRPARGGGVLRAYVPRHRQHRASRAIRQIAHHPDVATVAEPAGAAKGAAEGIGYREAHGKEERTGAVIRASPVMHAVDQRSQYDLRHVMSARRELVEHQMLARDGMAQAIRRLFNLVDRPRGERVVRDTTPVEPRAGSR